MRPSRADYHRIVEQNILRNCPVERRHIQAADDIFGPDVGALKGKTTRRTTAHVSSDRNPVPTEILQAHQHVTLAIDIMFINQLPFLVTLSRALRFIPTIKSKLLSVLHLYAQRGFKVHTILADGEFAPLESAMPRTAFNLCGTEEHVPEIERYIRTVKDRIRSCCNALPFQSIPRVMLARMVANAIFWLNSLPPKEGVSPTLSPRFILTGRHLDYTKHE